MKIKLNIEEMADACGIKFIRCDVNWGGTWGYTQDGSNSSFCGFKTKKAALKGWFEDEFDSKLGKYLLERYFTV
jgi:hypothetical protein